MTEYQRCEVLPLKEYYLLQSQPTTPKTIEQMRGGFLRAMSDAGLKPTVVYHNLTPAELYEKVCPCSLANMRELLRLLLRNCADTPKVFCLRDLHLGKVWLIRLCRFSVLTAY